VSAIGAVLGTFAIYQRAPDANRIVDRHHLSSQISNEDLLSPKLDGLLNEFLVKINDMVNKSFTQ
jgi:hypothetical protein